MGSFDISRLYHQVLCGDSTPLTLFSIQVITKPSYIQLSAMAFGLHLVQIHHAVINLNSSLLSKHEEVNFASAQVSLLHAVLLLLSGDTVLSSLQWIPQPVS